jgi:Tol biopolymer transport system component
VVFDAVRYTPDGNSVGGITVVDAAGNVEAGWQCSCSRPSWSADGKRLVVQSTQIVGSGKTAHVRVDLSIVNTDGTHMRTLLDDAPADRGPAWSPRGDLIAFYSTRGQSFEGSDIYVIRPDGRGLRRLTHMQGTHPTWSPDGRWIAFSGTPRPSEQPTQIYAIPVEGGTPIRLSTDPVGGDLIPVWSPDGTQIAYVGAYNFEVHEYVQRVASLPRSSRKATAARTLARCMHFRRGKPRRIRALHKAFIRDWQPRRRSKPHAAKLCRAKRAR